MPAHHFQAPDQMFAEARRVAKAGAVLIMREHDAREPYLALFFDLSHAMYSVVFNAEESPAEFAEKYAAGKYAYYRSRAGWTAPLEKAGWKLEQFIQPKLNSKRQTDFMESFYAVFRAQ